MTITSSDYVVTLGKVTLVAVPETSGCDGCYGAGSDKCDDLPTGCADRHIIWVEKTAATTIKAAILLLEES